MQEKWKKRAGAKWYQEVIIKSEVKRWKEPTALRSQMNEGPTACLQLDTAVGWNISTPSLTPTLQIVPCAGLSTHAAFSDKAMPGGGGGGAGRCAAFRGLIMPSGRLREEFGDASADRSLLGLHGLCVCRPAAQRHRENRFLVDWQHTKRLPPAGLTELSVGSREDDKEENGWRDYRGEINNRQRKKA